MSSQKANSVNNRRNHFIASRAKSGSVRRFFAKPSIVVASLLLIFLCGAVASAPSQGATISYEYDRLNRLTKVRYEGGTISYGYDPAGNRTIRSITLKGAPLAGDMNDDGLINAEDATLLLQLLSGMNRTGAQATADIDGNQQIGLEEVISILQKVGGVRP